MMKKKSATNFNQVNPFIKPARRWKTRLIRDTNSLAAVNMLRALDIAWATFAAMEDGQFSKNAQITTRAQAIIYALSHPDFDMERVRAICRSGTRRRLSSTGVRTGIARMNARATDEMRALFSESEGSVSSVGISLEFRRLLASLRGSDAHRYFRSAYEVFRRCRQLKLDDLDPESQKFIFPLGVAKTNELRKVEPHTFQLHELALYRRWQFWSVDDIAPGLAALDTLASDLRSQKRNYREDYDALSIDFHKAKFTGKSYARALSDDRILAVCIMAADYQSGTQDWVVKVDNFRAIADLFRQYMATGGTAKRRRRINHRKAK